MKGTIATLDSNGRRRTLKSTIAIIGLAGLLALVGPAAAEAGKPWMGHWHGSGKNPATGQGQFKVNFDVTRKKRVVDLVVKNYVTGCYDQQSRIYFPLTEFDQTDRLKRTDVGGTGSWNSWSFWVDQTFDDGFGFDYRVVVSGDFNKAWTRVRNSSFVSFTGSALGDECVPGADWALTK
jgi:hypothetical protein